MMPKHFYAKRSTVTLFAVLLLILSIGLIIFTLKHNTFRYDADTNAALSPILRSYTDEETVITDIQYEDDTAVIQTEIQQYQLKHTFTLHGEDASLARTLSPGDSLSCQVYTETDSEGNLLNRKITHIYSIQNQNQPAYAG